MRALARWTGPDLGRALRQALQARLRRSEVVGEGRLAAGDGTRGGPQARPAPVQPQDKEVRDGEH